MSEVDFIHKRTIIGPFEQPGCGGIAFTYKHRPKLGEKSDAKLVTNPSGTAINGQPIPCMCCDAPVGPAACEPVGGWAE